MTESASHVEQQVQQRIAAAKVRVQAAQERRAALAEARRYGIARRHAAKLRHLKDAEERAQQQDDEPGLDEADGQADGEQQAEGGAARVTATDNGEEAFGGRVRYGYR